MFDTSGFNQGDFDRVFKKKGGIVGKATRRQPRASEPIDVGGDEPTTLKAWVKKMDDTNGWPEFEKRVQEFSKEFKVPFSKAVIYILFNVF